MGRSPGKGVTGSWRLLPVAIVAALALLGPSTAAADSCGPDIEDGGGFLWDLVEDNGAVNDGEADTYDFAFHLEVSNLGTGLDRVGYSADPDSCGSEESGDEITYPARTTNASAQGFGGLTLARKVYISSTGTPFARWLNVIHNPTASDITATVAILINYGHFPDPIYRATSSGDTELTAGDRWATHSSPPGSGDNNDQPAATLFDSVSGAAETFDGIEGDLVEGGRALYVLTVPAGETVNVMTFAAQRATDAETLGFALANQGGSAELYAGLSQQERADVINWPADPDSDGDGRPDPLDNCPAVADAGQADLDGDGAGDACDFDDDGDGLFDAIESAIGSNPRLGDSDGDGRADGADACPVEAGSRDNGCRDLTRALKRCQKKKSKKKIRKCIRRVRRQLDDPLARV